MVSVSTLQCLRTLPPPPPYLPSAVIAIFAFYDLWSTNSGTLFQSINQLKKNL